MSRNHQLAMWAILTVSMLAGCATAPRPKLNENVGQIAFYNGTATASTKIKNLYLGNEITNHVPEDALKECKMLGTLATTVDVQPGSVSGSGSNFQIVLHNNSPETRDIKINFANEASKLKANTVVLVDVAPEDKGLSTVIGATGKAYHCTKFPPAVQSHLFIE